MKVKKRESFAEYDPTKVPNVEYLVFKEIPKCDDFEADKEKEIILRNKETGKLERISYVLEGSVPLYGTNRYLWYWGRIIPECGMNICFTFKMNGELSSIFAIYSAPSLSIEEYNRRFSSTTASEATAKY